MFVESNFIRCRMSFTHEEAESILRYLTAREHGGEMRSSDLETIKIFMTALVEHEEKVAEREARIDEVQSSVHFADAIQQCDDVNLNQIKEMFKKAREPQTAADDVADVDLTDVAAMCKRMKDSGCRVMVDDQVGIYQVMRD